MRAVVALGGNALLKRGEPMTAASQRASVRSACRALAPVAREHELVIAHGNGPQIALLGSQASAYAAAEAYPLDILGAQTDGMIGYMMEQELGNELPPEARVATILTMIEVDAADQAFDDPRRPIGPLYREDEAAKLEDEKGWSFKADGASFRRVVPSPMPKRIFGAATIGVLLDHGCVVICAGGGGIPTRYVENAAPAGRRLVGVEAVIDKDLATALLAIELEADVLVIATDVDAAYADWGTSRQRPIRRATPEALASARFAEGSMRPKIHAASRFVEETGRVAVIGSIVDAAALIHGEAGTVVALDAVGLETIGAPLRAYAASSSGYNRS